MNVSKQPPDMTKEQRKAVLDQRIAAVKASRPFGDYIVRGSAGIEQVVCKICGTPVRKLVPDERFRESRVVGNREVIVERLVFMTLPMYNEIAILFDDGSRHISVSCSNCVTKITNEDLEWIYLSDVQEMMSDAGAEGLNLAYYAHRVPVSFVVSPKGEVTP